MPGSFRHDEASTQARHHTHHGSPRARSCGPVSSSAVCRGCGRNPTRRTGLLALHRTLEHNGPVQAFEIFVSAIFSGGFRHNSQNRNLKSCCNVPTAAAPILPRSRPFVRVRASISCVLRFFWSCGVVWCGVCVRVACGVGCGWIDTMASNLLQHLCIPSFRGLQVTVGVVVFELRVTAGTTGVSHAPKNKNT